MRKLNWEKPFSEEDFAWIAQSGIPGLAERAERHQERHNAKVPEIEVPEDTLTKSALDPQGRAAESVAHTGPQLVDPTKPVDDAAPVEEDDEGDDYDAWSKADLDAEVSARNALPETSEVTVVGTGANGGIRKEDLVKGLRLWDQENPTALRD